MELTSLGGGVDHIHEWAVYCTNPSQSLVHVRTNPKVVCSCLSLPVHYSSFVTRVGRLSQQTECKQGVWLRFLSDLSPVSTGECIPARISHSLASVAYVSSEAT